MIDYRTPRRRDAEAAATDRRGFLKLAAAGGAAGLVAACGWDGGNSVRPSLLSLSRMNDWVGENILFSPTRLAKTYSPAERSRMLPSYFISDVMPALQNPSAWRFKGGGLVGTPLSLSLDDLTAVPPGTYTLKQHCVGGGGGVEWESGVWGKRGGLGGRRIIKKKKNKKRKMRD